MNEEQPRYYAVFLTDSSVLDSRNRPTLAAIAGVGRTEAEARAHARASSDLDAQADTAPCREITPALYRLVEEQEILEQFEELDDSSTSLVGTWDEWDERMRATHGETWGLPDELRFRIRE